MIRINKPTHTKGSTGILTIGKGSVLDVTPRYGSKRVKVLDENGDDTGNYKVEHYIAFDAKIYKNLLEYESNGNHLIPCLIEEYKIGYVFFNVDIQVLGNPAALLQIYLNHIENGDNEHSGVGSGNAEIIWPFSS